MAKLRIFAIILTIISQFIHYLVSKCAQFNSLQASIHSSLYATIVAYYYPFFGVLTTLTIRQGWVTFKHKFSFLKT